MESIIKINENDNVCVTLEDLKEGDIIDVSGRKILIKDDIKTGHKVAIKVLRAMKM